MNTFLNLRYTHCSKCYVRCSTSVLDGQELTVGLDESGGKRFGGQSRHARQHLSRWGQVSYAIQRYGNAVKQSFTLERKSLEGSGI